jgi:tetrahydromethanopterin S-methyltransferase subunit G
MIKVGLDVKELTELAERLDKLEAALEAMNAA